MRYEQHRMLQGATYDVQRAADVCRLSLQPTAMRPYVG